MLEICLFVAAFIAVPSGPKSHTFTVILAVFAPQPRWRQKPRLQSIFKSITKGVFLSANPKTDF